MTDRILLHYNFQLFTTFSIDIWKEYRSKCNLTQDQCPPDTEVCTYQELVLDEDGKKITERTCYPGHNVHGRLRLNSKQSETIREIGNFREK